MGGIQVGIASVDITPKLGLPLMGNFRDEYAARGTHDPLMAKAAVFSDRSGNKAAYLMIDVCVLSAENIAVVRRAIAERCDLLPGNVTVGATHTHSGPATTNLFEMDFEIKEFEADIEKFLVGAAEAVVRANENLSDATISVGGASENRIAFNRRMKRKDGTTQMNWEALAPEFDPNEIEGLWGPTDPEVVCLTIERDDKPVAALVNYGLHPAILAGDNWLYSADFPGYTAEAMSRMFGDGFTSLFLNGCCGNVNNIDYTDPIQGRGYKMTQRCGYMLAAAAHEAINSRKPVDGDCVATSSEKVLLDRIQISTDQHEWAKKVLEDAKTNPAPGQVDGMPDTWYANMYLKMQKQQHEAYNAEVTVMRIGDAAIVGLPGEVFCEFAMEIKRRSPAKYTLVSELCNDAIGYLPTEESFAQGGYEPSTGTSFFEKDSGARLTESAVSQLKKLF